MNKQRVPRQHRRYSLPVTSAMSPLGFSRSFPEGSDAFQKAFEDLCTNEPNHASAESAHDFGFNGLTDIQEDSESDCVESDHEINMHSDVIRPNRRYSSPSCFHGQPTGANSPGQSKCDTMERESIVTTHNNLRKEYFKKHGHWPVSNSMQSGVKRIPLLYHRDMTKSSVAFGSKVSK